MILDLRGDNRKQFITAIALHGVRNTELENIHAGEYEGNIIDDSTMRILMLDIEKQIDMVLTMIENNAPFPYMRRSWDVPQEEYDRFVALCESSK